MPLALEPIELVATGRALRFVHVPLTFVTHGLSDIFANKKNKSVRETLAHPRYKSLADIVALQHATELERPLGEFLAERKSRGDKIYVRFLNSHGDKVFCHFRMTEHPTKRKKGLYLYTLEAEVVYIGRSFDHFAKRVDQGYGKIHPKNCFIDGQSTNCHLNSMINLHAERLAFFVCPLSEDTEIAQLERALIQERRPRWNIALAR